MGGDVLSLQNCVSIRSNSGRGYDEILRAKNEIGGDSQKGFGETQRHEGHKEITNHSRRTPVRNIKSGAV